MKNVILLLSSVLIYLTSSASYAKKDNELLLKLTQCSSITSNDDRLLCFDKLVPTNIQQPTIAVTTVVAPVVDSKSVEEKQVNDFAKEHLKKTKEEQESTSIIATVSKVNKLLRGQWVIYFENGQKWQQTDSARIKLKIGNKVRLEKGAMGAVYLYKEGSHRSIKVKRLK